MLNDSRWISKSATYAAATLSEASWLAAIEAVAVIIFLSTNCTPLCPSAILLTTVLTDIPLHRNLHSMGIVVSKLIDAIVALAILLGHSTLEHCRNLDGNARIPALERGWLFSEMSIPHLLQALIEKWRA